MSHLKFLFFLFLWVPMVIMGAQIPSLSYEEALIYRDTKAICSEIKSTLGTILNKNTRDALMISMGESLSWIFFRKKASDFYPDRIEEAIFNEGLLSVYSLDRLQNEGFLTAVRECFPDNEKMQQRFVFSMISADALGKTPSVISLWYFAKASNLAWGKFGAMYPRVAKWLKWGGAAGVVLYTVLEGRKVMKDRTLTPEEEARVTKIVDNLHQRSEEVNRLVIELAEEEIFELEGRYAEATSPEEKESLLFRIEEIKHALSQLG